MSEETTAVFELPQEMLAELERIADENSLVLSARLPTLKSGIEGPIICARAFLGKSLNLAKAIYAMLRSSPGRRAEVQFYNEASKTITSRDGPEQIEKTFNSKTNFRVVFEQSPSS